MLLRSYSANAQSFWSPLVYEQVAKNKIKYEKQKKKSTTFWKDSTLTVI